ncbi:hypothetical protein EJ07DRAFT_155211 [Lizonia empirigonia]|nr:hypothetical protein EJ07DRAFT_155211 [Lizonia empirigonia]
MNNIAFTTSALQQLNHEWERTSLPPSSSSPYPVLIDTDNETPQNGNNQDSETLDSDENCYYSDDSDISYLDLNDVDEASSLGLGVPTPLLDEDGESDIGCDMDLTSKTSSQGEFNEDAQIVRDKQAAENHSGVELEIDVVWVIFAFMLRFILRHLCRSCCCC